MMLDDLKLDTVDFVPTYDERRTEPTVLPSKFPNLLVNGSRRHRRRHGHEHSAAQPGRGLPTALIALIDNPDVSIDELMEIIPGPDFPTGGIICGRTGIRRGYQTGRSTVVVRARTTIEDTGKKTRIVVHEIPYQQARDRVEERIAAARRRGQDPRHRRASTTRATSRSRCG